MFRIIICENCSYPLDAVFPTPPFIKIDLMYSASDLSENDRAILERFAPIRNHQLDGENYSDDNINEEEDEFGVGDLKKGIVIDSGEAMSRDENDYDEGFRFKPDKV